MTSNNDVQATLSEVLYDEDVLDVLNQERDREEEERQNVEFLQWKAKPKEVRVQENGYVSRMYEKIDYLLKMYKHSRNRMIVDFWDEKLANLIEGINKEREHFSDKQWDIIIRKVDEWGEAVKSKEKYFAMKAGTYIGSKEDCEENDNSSDGHLLKELGGAPLTFDKEDNEWILRQLSTEEDLKVLKLEPIENNTPMTENNGQQ